jgi:hypothetical protein
MDDLIFAAREVQEFMEARTWPFAIIGGVANMAWGEVRLTRDVDLTLYTAFVNEPEFIDEVRIADARRLRFRLGLAGVTPGCAYSELEQCAA